MPDNKTAIPPYVTDTSCTGVALSANGYILYAVSLASGITLIDIAAGQFRHFPQNPAHAPWGTEWITN